MKQVLTIALDAMGGDHAPLCVIEGAELVRIRSAKHKKFQASVSFLMFGDEAKITPVLKRFPQLDKVTRIVHTDQFISNEDKPSAALRNKKSSMRMAIDAVANGQADCIVSGGNTGALMVTSKMVLKALAGITRPAIASIFPTSKGKDGRVVALDLGANVDCDSDNLVQFAILGSVFAQTALDVEEPTVGILNIGEEEMKGSDSVRQAATQLREIELPGSFYGFVEGNDIGKGTVDVIVTDGFTGNVALKTMEGTANLLYDFMKDAFFGSVLSKVLALLSYFSFKRLKQRMDPRNYNGGVFLGLNGISVKSHGGTDSKGFSNAIWFAYRMAYHNYNERVSERLDVVSQGLKNDADSDVKEPKAVGA